MKKGVCCFFTYWRLVKIFEWILLLTLSPQSLLHLLLGLSANHLYVVCVCSIGFDARSRDEPEAGPVDGERSESEVVPVDDFVNLVPHLVQWSMKFVPSVAEKLVILCLMQMLWRENWSSGGGQKKWVRNHGLEVLPCSGSLLFN